MAASVAMLSCGLHKYEGFKHIKTLLDVGGGVGKALGVLVSSYPKCMASTSINLTLLLMLPTSLACTMYTHHAPPKTLHRSYCSMQFLTDTQCFSSVNFAM
jgi:hypothetical protein